MAAPGRGARGGQVLVRQDSRSDPSGQHLTAAQARRAWLADRTEQHPHATAIRAYVSAAGLAARLERFVELLERRAEPALASLPDDRDEDMRVVPGADEGANSTRHAVDRGKRPRVGAEQHDKAGHRRDQDRSQDPRARQLDRCAARSRTQQSPIDRAKSPATPARTAARSTARPARRPCPPGTTPAQPATGGKARAPRAPQSRPPRHATACDPRPDERPRRRAPAPDRPTEHALAVRTKPSPPARRRPAGAPLADRHAGRNVGVQVDELERVGPVGHQAGSECEELAQLGAQPQEVLAARVIAVQRCGEVVDRAAALAAPEAVPAPRRRCRRRAGWGGGRDETGTRPCGGAAPRPTAGAARRPRARCSAAGHRHGDHRAPADARSCAALAAGRAARRRHRPRGMRCSMSSRSASTGTGGWCLCE